jgi:hypothetical protein
MHIHLETPSAWVVRWAPLIARGPVLDVASGTGRHAKLFAARGLEAVAVDRDAQSIPGVPLLAASLDPQGVLIYETFMIGNERFGKPSNPNFLLRPGELLQAFSALTVVAFEQGTTENAVVQRICVIRAEAGSARIRA